MSWTFMGKAMMYNDLWGYGDCISQIGLFSFNVRATGNIYECGVSIFSMLTISNDGTNIIFADPRDNTDVA